MQPQFGILLLTFRELWAKKVVIGLFVISTLILLLVAFALNLDVVDGTLAGLRLFGQDAVTSDEAAAHDLPSLREVVFHVEAAVAGIAYWIGILLALFATAPLATALLERGHIDLLISKPLSRFQLLGGHILGVWSAMFILALYLLGGVWLLMSIKTGIWNTHFLLSILIVVGMFAVMYAPIIFMSVWTESTALSLIIAYGLIFISLFLAGGEAIADHLGATSGAVFWTLYHVLPNFSEVTRTVSELAMDETVESWYPLFSSFAFGVVLYAAAVVWFGKRDF